MKKKYLMIISLIILMLFSLINIYQARNINLNYQSYFLKELIWYLLSFSLLFLMKKFNLDYLLNHSLYLYLLGNLLLLITLFKGTNINGSTSWLKLGIFSFQPSEFMKIFLLFYLRSLSLKKMPNLKYFIITLIIFLIPSLLTFLEPDTGAVIIYGLIYLTFLILKKFKLKYYLLTLGGFLILIIAFFSLYFNSKALFINLFGSSFFYRMDRITSFLNGDGYQINKALSSIKLSSFWGIKKYLYYPEAPTDFAFTLLINNFGYFGMLLFLITYLLFISSLLKFNTDKYLLYPFIIPLIIQYSINLLMNINLFPIIGITLPLISYGGSNLLSLFLLLGFILNKKVPECTYL